MFFNISEATCGVNQGWCLLMLMFVWSVNVLFFLYSINLFRNAWKKASENFLAFLLAAYGGKIKCNLGVNDEQEGVRRRSSVHMNPLKRSRALTERKVTLNPIMLAAEEEDKRRKRSKTIEDNKAWAQTKAVELQDMRKKARADRAARVSSYHSKRAASVSDRLSPSAKVQPMWFAVKDKDTGYTYYCDHGTGQKSWHMPQENLISSVSLQTAAGLLMMRPEDEDGGGNSDNDGNDDATPALNMWQQSNPLAFHQQRQREEIEEGGESYLSWI